MKNQKHLNVQMRKILVDWLYEVSVKFKLYANTFRTAISLLDLAISKNKDILRNELQLWGIVCLSISSKLNEIYSPEVTDYVHICDNAYNSSQIIEKELFFLKQIDYKVYTHTELSMEDISSFAKEKYKIDPGSWKSIEYGLDLIKMAFLNDSYKDKCESIFAFACELENKKDELILTSSQKRIVELLNEDHETQQKSDGRFRTIYETYYKPEDT